MTPLSDPRPRLIARHEQRADMRPWDDVVDALAQSRRPMDMMSQGWSMSLFHAPQQ